MDKLIKKISVQFAIVMFFLMAIISMTNKVPLITCCIRAMTGAIIAYVVASFAARAIFAIVIYAIAKSKEE